MSIVGWSLGVGDRWLIVDCWSEVVLVRGWLFLVNVGFWLVVGCWRSLVDCLSEVVSRLWLVVLVATPQRTRPIP